MRFTITNETLEEYKDSEFIKFLLINNDYIKENEDFTSLSIDYDLIKHLPCILLEVPLNCHKYTFVTKSCHR